jgi:hypothetical protein
MPAVVRLLCVGGCIDGVYVCDTIVAAVAVAVTVEVAGVDSCGAVIIAMIMMSTLTILLLDAL